MLRDSPAIAVNFLEKKYLITFDEFKCISKQFHLDPAREGASPGDLRNG